MGTGSSKSDGFQILTDTFAIDERMSKDLDRLSFIASRILNSSDIYDINNLVTKGECGNYVLFLKKQITKDISRIDKPSALSSILPFTASSDKDGKSTTSEILYHNPLKSIQSTDRDVICTQIADTMVRAIAIILACLASIQITSPSREFSMSTGVQKGGRIDDVVQKSLYNLGVLHRDGKIKDMVFDNKFQFEFSTNKQLTESYIHRVNSLASFKFVFLDPIQNNHSEFVPFKLVSKYNMPWGAGIIISGPKILFFELNQVTTIAQYIHMLFEKKLQHSSWMLKSVNKFETLLQNNTIDTLLNIVGVENENEILQLGLSNESRMQDYKQQQQQQQYGYRYGREKEIEREQDYFSFVKKRDDIFQHGNVQIPKHKLDLKKKLTSFTPLISSQSSPAAVRAKTLAGILDRTRTYSTQICNDPYWNLTSLKNLYPWATFQFLAVKDWSKFTEVTSDNYNEHWIGFLEQLDSVYKDKLLRPNKTMSLETMKFINSKQIKIGVGNDTCDTNSNPRVHFKAVQDGLTTLHNLYDDHVTKIWKILNSLVIVIRDPQTNSDSIRIHPNIVNPANGGSKKVVETLANSACELLKNFYIEVENIYLESISKLQVQKIKVIN